MMAKIKDVVDMMGSNSRSYAKRIGCRTSALARNVDIKRGGTLLSILAATILLPFVVRAVRRRRQERSYDRQAERWGATPSRRRRRSATGRTYAEPSAFA